MWEVSMTATAHVTVMDIKIVFVGTQVGTIALQFVDEGVFFVSYSYRTGYYSSRDTGIKNPI